MDEAAVTFTTAVPDDDMAVLVLSVRTVAPTGDTEAGGRSTVGDPRA